MIAVATVQDPARRSTADLLATILLLIGHLALIVVTVAAVVIVEVRVDACGPYASSCGRDAWGWLDETVGVVLVGSALLFVVDLVLAIRRMASRRRAFHIPLLCCAVQVMLIVATFVAGEWAIA